MDTRGGNDRAGELGSTFLCTDKFLLAPGAYVPSTFIPPGGQKEAEDGKMEEP